MKHTCHAVTLCRRILYSIVIISIMITNFSYTLPALVAVAQTVDKSLDKQLPVAGAYLVAASSQVGVGMTKEAGVALQTNMPAIEKALSGVGSQFGLETVTAIGAGIVFAAPYVAGAVVIGAVGYGGYKGVQYCFPGPERRAKIAQANLIEAKVKEEREVVSANKEFKDCFFKFEKCRRNSRGFPSECQQAATKLVLMGGSEQITKTINDYSKFAPAK